MTFMDGTCLTKMDVDKTKFKWLFVDNKQVLKHESNLDKHDNNITSDIEKKVNWRI